MSNAIISCRTCKKKFDKGCPAQPGQDDSTFTCEDCQNLVNAAHLKKVAPTVSLDGAATSNDVALEEK